MILCTFVLSMSVFYLSYRINNKYTAGSELPVHGVLCADQKEDENRIFYLSREWQYYPDVLLTPELLKQKDDYYSRYISIGETADLNSDSRDPSPYGSGTYRMLILLPEEERTWAFFLPEVFSAYKIYINGELAGQVGEPDPDAYRDEVFNRLYTFRAAGTAEILIAVSDQTAVASGIRYIPVFGSPVKVNMERGIKILLNGFCMALCLAIAFYSLVIFLKNRTAEFGIFSLICITVVMYSIYPVLHSFLMLHVQPWYALETLGYYMMLALIIWLEQRILKLSHRLPLIAVPAVWAVGAFVLELNASKINSSYVIYF